MAKSKKSTKKKTASSKRKATKRSTKKKSQPKQKRPSKKIPGNISFRKATSADVIDLEVLDREWHKEGSSPYHGKVVASDEFLEGFETGNTIAIVAQRDKNLLRGHLKDKFVGFLAAERMYPARDDPNHKTSDVMYFISGYYVTKEFRGKGIGSKLLDMFYKEVEKENISELNISVDSTDVEGLTEFFKSHDFTTMWVQMKKVWPETYTGHDVGK